MTTIYVVCDKPPPGSRCAFRHDCIRDHIYYERERADQAAERLGNCEVREYVVLEPEEARGLREGA